MLSLPSIKNYINPKELAKSWVASGFLSALASAGVAWLTYVAGHAGEISQNGLIAAFLTFVATKAAADLEALRKGIDVKPAPKS